MSLSPITSNSTPRKRSKWDVEQSDSVDEESHIVKKRLKPKTIRTNEPSSSHSRLPNPPPARSLAHSKYVPPRTIHPPIQSSRSVYAFERLNQIEEGSYGVVFRARDKGTGDIVALKKLKLDDEKFGFPITSLREINALIACKHDNVVGIREIVVGETLTQYVDGTTYAGHAYD
jgi:cell division cycle 2-like protein